MHMNKTSDQIKSCYLPLEISRGWAHKDAIAYHPAHDKASVHGSNSIPMHRTKLKIIHSK